MTSHVERLKSMDACYEGLAFAQSHKSMKSAWDACRNPQWMLWFVRRMDYRDDQSYRLFACWCVRQIWHLLDDERSRHAVEVTERFATGEATAQVLAAAGDAAWDARAAARDARDAARDTARDAAWSAAGDAAWDAARDAAGAAAWAAAWDAAGAAAWDAARDAAWSAAWAAQCDKIREMLPWAKVSRCASKKWSQK